MGSLRRSANVGRVAHSLGRKTGGAVCRAFILQRTPINGFFSEAKRIRPKAENKATDGAVRNNFTRKFRCAYVAVYTPVVDGVTRS